MEEILEDNGLKEFIDTDIPEPNQADVAQHEAWRKNVAKARRNLLEGVRDHIVSSLQGQGKSICYVKALTDMFQSSSDHRKLALKENLRKIKIKMSLEVLGLL